jgi:hypothetical protein
VSTIDGSSSESEFSRNVKIGVSGHQNLGSEETATWVRAEIQNALLKENFLSGISSLAAGTDQLFAQIVLDLNRPIEVVIPCEHYEDAFSDPKAVEIFRELKARATKSYLLPYREPSEKAFFEAGKRVVQMSNVVVAVWNGKPAAGMGGTGDIVKYALRAGKKVLHLHTERKTVRLLKDS